MISRLSISVILLVGIACQSTNPFYCPTPETVKLRKAKAHRMKYALAKHKQAKANSYDFFQETSYKAKELAKIEEWDCPKPGLKHDKMVQKKARDLQRRYAKNLKKIAKQSQDRTVTVYSESNN